MKQKVLFMLTILGIALSLQVVLPGGDALAQQPDCTADPAAAGCEKPPECADDPELPQCKPDEGDKPACAPGSDGCCGGVKTSIIGGEICGSTEDGESVIMSMLKLLLKIMTAGVGIAAVGGIAYGALLYTTAESKPEQTKKAIGIITNVVIGIVAYALMAIFLNFLIPGGVIGS